MKLHLPLSLYKALLTVVVASASLISSQAVADLVITTDTTEPGDQIVEGSISVEGAKLDVGSDQTATTNIKVVDNAEVTVGGDQSAQNGGLAVSGSVLKVTGAQSIKRYISIVNSAEVTVGGDQTAQNESISVGSGSTLAVTGKQTAGEVISLVGARDVTVGNNQTAKNISATNDSTLTVGGDQTATAGSIYATGSKMSVTGNQTAYTDITITNSDGANKGVTVGGDQTATTGSINATDSKMSVTGNQTARTDITIKNSDGANKGVTVGGNQTATTGSITTEKTKLDITGKQTAAETIDIKLSRKAAGLGVTIGQGQEAKNIKIDEATLIIQAGGQHATEELSMIRMSMDTTVNGDQTAKTIDLRSGGMTLNGNQTAGESISIRSSFTAGSEPGWGTIINGNQTAGTDITLESTAKVKLSGNQTANGNIKITGDSLLEADGDQTATTGKISTERVGVTVRGNQTAGTDIELIKDVSMTVGTVGTETTPEVVRNQTAGNNISITDSYVNVTGNQTAGNNISVTDSLHHKSQSTTIGGNQTAENGSISVVAATNLTVKGDQTAKTDISLETTTSHSTFTEIGAHVTVGGDQTAETGSISVTGSNLNITGNQTAGGDISINAKNIDANGSLLTSDVTVGGDQTAQNISVTNSTLTVGGDQKAQNATLPPAGGGDAIPYALTPPSNITIDGSDVTVEGNQIADTDIDITNSSTVTVGENQTAGNHISVDDSTLGVGGDQSARGGISITNTSEVTVGGDQTSQEGAITVADSSLGVTGDQSSKTNITIVNGSEVTVEGSQTSQDGGISVNGSTLEVGDDQSAKGDIMITATSDVTVGGDQTSQDGGIVVSGSTLEVTEGQTVKTNIEIVTDSEVTVGGDQTAQDGIIAVADSTLDVTGNQTAGTNISLSSDSDVTVGGNQSAQNISVDASSLEVDGNQTATADILLTEGSDVTVGGDQTAGNGINVIDSKLSVTGDQIATADITITDSVAADGKGVTVGGNQTAQDGLIVVAGSTLGVTGDQTAKTGIGIFADSTVTVGGDQTAQDGFIRISDSTVTVDGTMTAQKADNDGNMITIDGSNVTVGDSMVAADGGTIRITDGSEVEIDNRLVAEDGSLIINGGAGSVVKINSDNTPAPVDSVIGSEIATITVGAGNRLETGDVLLNDVNLTVNGTLKATNWLSQGTNTVNGSGVNEGEVTVSGDLIFAETSTLTKAQVVSTNGKIVLKGSNELTNSTVQTESGNIGIVTGTEDSDRTIIQDSDILSAGAIIISGRNANNQALVTGDTLVKSQGSQTYGPTGKTGILLKDVNLKDMTRDMDVVAAEGNVTLEGTVDMTNAKITVNSSSLAPEESIPQTRSGRFMVNNRREADGSVPGTIMMESSAILNMHRQAILEGTLSSEDNTALIVKDGGDSLKLDYSTRNYHGTIKVIADDGSDLVINCDGVGMDSQTVLKDTNLTVSREAFDDASDGTVWLGSVDTTSDTGVRIAPQGPSPSGIGTIITVNAGEVGDTVRGRNWSMNSHTLLTAEHALDASGTFTADLVRLDGKLDANGVRVFGTLLTGDAHEATVADQTRVRIVTMEGPDAAVLSKFNEDMLYDIVLDAETGTYQRIVKTLNAWVETTAEGVNLVYSKNYRGASGKSETQQAVADVLDAISGKRNHTEGTLAASDSQLDRLLDAFDYTRSEEDALHGLSSVAGVGNTLVQHSVMDSSRHHMDTLRGWITLPSCSQTTVMPRDAKQPIAMWQPDTQSSIWMTYTGGYDLLNGNSSSMGDYTRTYQGVLAGYQRQLDCRLLVGLSLGYENSISRSDAIKFTADTYYADLYAAARTGRFNHRLSIGMGIHDFDTERHIYVAAGSHSFSGSAEGGLCARSLNVGYELSTDFQLTKTSDLTPFLTVNYAYHSFNNLKEYGMGDAGLVTSYKDLNQLELGLGAEYTKRFSLIKDQDQSRFFASLALRAEISDRSPEAVNSFKGNPDVKYRIKSQERSPMFIQVGAGLNVPFSRQWSATLSGSGEFGNDRASVNGSIGVNYSF